MSNKELTATQFNKDPAQFYRAAYDGETVTISHDHYGQGLFELTYRKRGFKPDKEQLNDEQKNDELDKLIVAAGLRGGNSK